MSAILQTPSYSTLRTLRLGTVVNIPVIFLFAWFKPAVLICYALGMAIGMGYVQTLFLSALARRPWLALGISFLRMLLVSFLIVWAGQFHMFETGVVFCGFLSYILVLIADLMCCRVKRSTSL